MEGGGTLQHYNPIRDLDTVYQNVKTKTIKVLSNELLH